MVVCTAPQLQCSHLTTATCVPCCSKYRLVSSHPAGGSARSNSLQYARRTSAPHYNTFLAALPKTNLLQSILPDYHIQIVDHPAAESGDPSPTQDSHHVMNTFNKGRAVNSTLPDARGQWQRTTLHPHLGNALAGQPVTEGMISCAGVADTPAPLAVAGAAALEASTSSSTQPCSPSAPSPLGGIKPSSTSSHMHGASPSTSYPSAGHAAAPTAAAELAQHQHDAAAACSPTSATSILSDLLDVAAMSSCDALGPGITTTSLVMQQQQQQQGFQAASAPAPAQVILAHSPQHPGSSSSTTQPESQATQPGVHSPVSIDFPKAGSQVVQASKQNAGSGLLHAEPLCMDPQPPDVLPPVDQGRLVEGEEPLTAAALPMVQELAAAPFFGPPYPMPTPTQLHHHHDQQQLLQQEEQEAFRATEAAAQGAVQLGPAEALMAEAWMAAAGAMAAMWGLDEQQQQLPAGSQESGASSSTSADSPGGLLLTHLLGQPGSSSSSSSPWVKLPSKQGINGRGDTLIAAVGLGVVGVLKQLGTLVPAHQGGLSRRLGLTRLVAGSDALSAAAATGKPSGSASQSYGQSGGRAPGVRDLPLTRLQRVPGQLQELGTALKLGWRSSVLSGQQSISIRPIQLPPLPQLRLPCFTTSQGGSSSSSSLAPTDGTIADMASATAGASSHAGEEGQPHDQQHPHTQQLQVQGAAEEFSRLTGPPTTSEPLHYMWQPQPQVGTADANPHLSSSGAVNKQHTASLAPQAPAISLALPSLPPGLTPWQAQPSLPTRTPVKPSGADSPASTGLLRSATPSDSPGQPVPGEGSSGSRYGLDIRGHLFEGSGQHQAGSDTGAGPSDQHSRQQGSGAGWGSLLVATASAALAVGAAVLALAAALVAAGMVLAFAVSRVAPGLARAAPILQSLVRGLQACVRFAFEVWRLWQATNRGPAPSPH